MAVLPVPLSSSSHHMEKTEAGLKGLCIREIMTKYTLYYTKADLIELYKMSRGTASVPLQNFFTLAPQHVPTRGHSWKLMKPHSSADARRFFFSVQVINKWNSLPQEAVDASSVNMFKNQLDRIRNTRMGFFMDSVHGCTTL